MARQPNQYRPVTTEEIDEVKRLHAAGCSRNEICRRTGRSNRWVSATAADLGLSFERMPGDSAALKARRADLAQRRIALAEALQTDAERLSEQLWQPTTVYAFGGKENTYEQHTLPEAPAAEKRALMSAAATAIDRSVKLLPPEAGDGADEVGSLLTGLFDRLRERHGDA